MLRKFILALSFLTGFLALASTSQATDHSGLCREHFRNSQDASVDSSCRGIQNDAAGNCVIYLRQDQTYLIDTCASLPDTQIGSECIRQLVMEHGELDSDLIAECRNISGLER